MFETHTYVFGPRHTCVDTFRSTRGLRITTRDRGNWGTWSWMSMMVVRVILMPPNQPRQSLCKRLTPYPLARSPLLKSQWRSNRAIFCVCVQQTQFWTWAAWICATDILEVLPHQSAGYSCIMINVTINIRLVGWVEIVHANTFFADSPIRHDFKPNQNRNHRLQLCQLF